MQQHPVPQHIASYEFRLIGDMTLKQFGMLAVCAVMALLSYSSGLPGYFKWPLVLFFLIFGVALAFIPIEERPMHRWLLAFFKAVYSPTQFIWRKKPQTITLFESSVQVQEEPLAETRTKTRVDSAPLQEYLQSLPSQKAKIDQEEEGFLDRVGSFFESQPALSPAVSRSATGDEPSSKKEGKPKLAAKPGSKTKPVEPPVAVVPPLPLPPKQQEMTYSATAYQPQVDRERKVVTAKTSTDLPIPQVPKIPNLPVGMVLDTKGNLVEGAILEIRDKASHPVRALKTDRLGQFRIATPLNDGVYEIETEKKDLKFDIIKLELVGKPVPPLEIRAKTS